jgi:hypothetical protein
MAWREAVRLVDARPGHQAYNVIVDVANPVARATLDDPVVAAVSDFLESHGEKPIETIANTIFPAALYRRHGAPQFFDRFRDNVLPKIRRSEKWSGYYFERMMQLPQPKGPPVNQIWDIVQRIRDPKVRAKNKFELSVFDPGRDVNKSPYGGQCLSFASLKLVGSGAARSVTMTVLYRNHFYSEKLLGNLIGLGRLLDFIAKESGVGLGSLTIVSTHAEIDLPGTSTRQDLKRLLSQCDETNAQLLGAV